MRYIFVIAEIFEGVVQPGTMELVAAALKIKELQQSGIIKIIVLLDDPLPVSRQIARQTGIDVVGINTVDINLIDLDATDPVLATGIDGAGIKNHEFQICDYDVYKQCLSQFIKRMDTSHILIANTPQCQNFAPGLAVKIKAASIPGVNSIGVDDKGLTFSRPVLNSTKNMILRPKTDIPLVLTIMPGAFQFEISEKIEAGKVEISKVPFDIKPYRKNRIKFKEKIKKPCDNQALKEAKIVVSVGQGVGKKESIDTIFHFSKYFPSSAVGVSRPLVDMGWIGYEHQVGVTGTTVSPKLYIACGISGSSQHLAGMKDAQFVVSINNNPAAPIFSHSDICIVENLFDFIKVFIKEVEQT